METLQKDPILEFNSNVIEVIRGEYHLHQPGAMAEVIDSFEEWVQKQSHFIKKDFPRHYLETSVIMAKGSLERAKLSLDKLCTLKTLMPRMFNEHNVKNLAYTMKYMHSTILPKQMKDNYRVYIIRYLSSDLESSILFDYYKFIMLILEYTKVHDYLKGFAAVLDCRDIDNIVTFAMKINVVQLREAVSTVLEGYAMRIKGIHVISSSKAIEVLVAIIRQVVSSKIGDRIQVHRTLEELYEHVPKELLPVEYGGKEKPLRELNLDLVNVLSKEKNLEYLKEICQAGTNEALRQTDKYNDQVLGMPGSFRTLRVD